MKFEDFISENKYQVDDIKYNIKKIKDKKNHISLFLDDDKIDISIENYFKYNISNQKGLDENLYLLFKKEEEYLYAKNRILYKLSIKDYSIKQIKDYLYKNYDLETNEINTLINYFINIKLLDDDRYCISKINYLIKDKSNKQIISKLLKDGISQDIIDNHLVYNKDIELNKAISISDKLNRSIKNKSLNAKKQTILTKLISLGYSYEISNKALNKLDINNDNEINLLEKEYQKVLNKYSKKYSDFELRNKIYQSLLMKGFNNDDIKEVMHV